MSVPQPPQVAIAVPPVGTDEIHVWTFSPQAVPAEAEALVAYLSEHERHRAARMRHVDERHAFIVGRARVRQVLGGYVGQPPAQVDVVTRVDRRPTIAGAPAWFDFSFSRCEGAHVCAIGRDRRLGVDVQRVGAVPPGVEGADAPSMTSRQAGIFSPDDLIWLAARLPEHRDAARAELWTKKEAFAKAVGGLTLSLRAVEVPRTGDGAINASLNARPPQGRWLVRRFDAAPGVLGAVAAEGAWRLTILRHPA